MKNINFCAKANMKRGANKSKNGRRVLLGICAALTAAAIVFCTACTGPGAAGAASTDLPQASPMQTENPLPVQGGTLKMPMPQNLNRDNPNYDPLIVTTEEALALYSLVFEGLIGIDESNSLVPSLAINWSADEENANSWIINLRENVKWHSGEAFTADDVVYTFNRLYVLGTESYYSDALSNIGRIEAIDATTLRVTMNSPGMIALYSLSFPIIHENAEPLVGTGAYRAGYVSNTRIRLESNAEWWDRPPYIDTVEFYARESNATALASYDAGQLNFVQTALLTVGQYSEAGKTTVTDIMTQSMEVMLVNHNRAFVSRVEFRRAIAHALNRTKLITNAYMNRARAADVPVPPDSWLYNSGAVQYDYNLNSANAILDELGSRVGADGKRTLNGSPIELTLLTSGTTENTVRSEAAGMIAEQLAAVGITVNVVTAAHSYGNAESDYMKALAAGDWDLALCGFNLAQSNDLEPYLSSDGRNNFGHYNSGLFSDVSAALDKMAAAADEESLRSAAYELQSAFTDELPFIVLYFRLNSIVYSSKLECVGTMREPAPMRNIKNWYFKETTNQGNSD